MSTTKLVLARVLVDAMILATAVKANQLAEGEPDVIKEQVKAGVLDDSAAAVKYCKEQDAAVVRIEKPLTRAEQEKAELAEKREAAAKLVADLEAAISAAADADKPALETQLAEAQAAVEALK